MATVTRRGFQTVGGPVCVAAKARVSILVVPRQATKIVRVEVRVRAGVPAGQ
jgi:hypothetical protein